MKRLSTLFVSIMAVFSLLFVPVMVASPVSAQTAKDEICKGINNGSGCSTSGTNNLNRFIKNIVNILLFIVGAVAVIMIIIGGLRYVLSGGDSSSTKSARDTILYAVIGLVVAVASYAIVNFVVLRI